MTAGETPGPGGPDPRRVADVDGLSRELDLLRRRAAYGTAKSRIGLAELARRSEVPRSTVHTYVNGLRLPPADVLDRIVVALGAESTEQAAWAEALERVELADRTQRDDASAAPAAVPRQLPPAPQVFVGRDAALTVLDDVGPDRPHRLAVLTGGGGMGKSALAAHWARRRIDRFPDGQLHVDLQGFGPHPPREPRDVLARLLRGLDVEPHQVPGSLDERAELFADRTEGRRLLVLLDNARDVAQVRALISSREGVTTLVTSRSDLAELVLGLDALPVAVGPLDEAEVDELVDRAADERGEGAEVLRAAMGRCAGMPLALRIVGERWRRGLGDAADTGTAPSGPGDLLDEMGLGGGALDVRTTLGWTLDQLPEAERRVFARMSAVPQPVVDAEMVAVAADLSLREARRALESLAAVHLVAPGEGGFTRHDLVSAYARECYDDEAPDVRRATEARLGSHVLGRVQQASRALAWIAPVEDADPERAGPGFAGSDAAFRWLERHVDLLVALAADGAVDAPVRWAVAATLGRFRYTFDPTVEVDDLLGEAARSARRARDDRAVCVLEYLRGIVCAMAGDQRGAWRRISIALARARRRDWPAGVGMAQSGLAKLLGRLGRHDEAIAHFEELIARGDGLEDVLRMGLAEVLFDVGDLDGARTHAAWVVDHQPTRLAHSTLPTAFFFLAQTSARSHDPRAARAALDEAPALDADAEVLHREDRLLTELDIAVAEDRLDGAASLGRRVLRDLGATLEAHSACGCLLLLADVDRRRGDEEAATVWLADCRLTADEAGLGHWTMLAMLQSARLAQVTAGDQAARVELVELVEQARRSGSRPVEERAHELAAELGLGQLPV